MEGVYRGTELEVGEERECLASRRAMCKAYEKPGEEPPKPGEASISTVLASSGSH